MVLLFIGVAVWFAFIQPFKPDAVRDPIPAKAAFVYRAENAGELLLSPVGLQLSKTFGSEATLQRLVYDNHKASQWVNVLAASELAVADLPSSDGLLQKTWVMASWVGWRSPWIRWRLGLLGESDGLVFRGQHAVWPVWQFKGDFLPPNLTLTCSLTDNLFIACLSGNPDDIRYVLDTYDKRFDSVNVICKESRL